MSNSALKARRAELRETRPSPHLQTPTSLVDCSGLVEVRWPDQLHGHEQVLLDDSIEFPDKHLEGDQLPDYDAIAASFTSPAALRRMCAYPNTLGAGRKATLAFESWTNADERYIGGHHPFQVPGGAGSGWVLHAYWDPRVVTPDLSGLAVAAMNAIPDALLREDQKLAWKTRNRKLNTYFIWQGMRSRPLTPWLQERFGVSGCVAQLLDESEGEQDTAAVIVKDGVDSLWTFAAK